MDNDLVFLSGMAWDTPGKNTGVGFHSLLQGTFPTQGLKTGPPALQADSLPSEPQRSPIF